MNPAIENLKTNQNQLDADGCMVGVSRQALDEVLTLLDNLQYAIEPFEKAARVIAAHDGNYASRIVMLGGLADSCDLTKTHFSRLLEASNPLT